MRWFSPGAIALLVLCCASVASAVPSFPIVLEGIRYDGGVPTFSWSFEARASGDVRMDISGDLGTWSRDPTTQTLLLDFPAVGETYALQPDGVGPSFGCDPGRPHLSGDVLDAAGQPVATWEGCAYW